MASVLQSRPYWLIVLLLATSPLFAIAPRNYTDAELANFPVIVVAQWEKQKKDKASVFRRHCKIVKNERGEKIIKRFEFYTKLKIIRTVKGDEIKPGEYDLKGSFGISWRLDGTGLESGTSTQILGDVDDLTVPRLWFLKQLYARHTLFSCGLGVGV